MPAILVGPPQRNEQMWQALKTHILRERQRKKQGVYTVERPVSLLQLEYSIMDTYVNFSFALTFPIQKVLVYLDRVSSKKLVHKDYHLSNVLYCMLEQEADAEEERLRKERERQQKQDVMTLGETREQISNLDNELSQLKAEKHQLFLQLKKVLNEDDRRRQLIKETKFASQLQFLKGLRNRNIYYV